MERVIVHMECMFSTKVRAFGHVYRNRNCSHVPELDTAWFLLAASCMFSAAGEESQALQYILTIYFHSIRLHLCGLPYELRASPLLPGRTQELRVIKATCSCLVGVTGTWHTISATI
jgi:hypothetical protein